MTDQSRPLADSELPTFDRPVEIIENPYASDARHYSPEIHLFDEAMIHKYNRQGPRYTSYPTALEFKPIAYGVEAQILQNRDERVPLSLYFKDSRVKVELGLCKGKKLYDKRDADAQRSAKREIDRTIKEKNY